MQNLVYFGNKATGIEQQVRFELTIQKTYEEEEKYSFFSMN